MLSAVPESSAINQDAPVDQDGPIEHGDPVDSSLVGELDGVVNAINEDDVVEGASQSSADVDVRLSGDGPGDVSSIADNDGNAGNYCFFLNSMFISNVIITMV